MAKMNKKWVVLCSTAIGAIYAAGYFATETQATLQQPVQQAQVNTQTNSGQPSPQAQANTQVESSQPPQQAQVTTQPKSSEPPQQAQVNTQPKSSQPPQQAQANTQPKSSQSPQQAQANTQPKSSQPPQQAQVTTQPKSSQIYKDGTYKGTGINRRGSIEAAVTIKSDKITDVQISHFAMHYTIDDVVGLPQEVVQKQSAQVKNVSGATYSTQAFKDAVQVALSQARNM